MNNTILIIEDDKTILENTSSLLSEEGYIVIQARSGEEGLKIVKERLIHLILCDIKLPGIDGFEILKIISNESRTRTIPFIFLTAKVEKEDIQKGMDLGAVDYILKPFDSDTLLSRIAGHLKK